MELIKYKDKPLIRKGKLLYYGDFDAAYILALEVLDTEKVKKLVHAKKVKVKLQTNAMPGKEKILKEAERGGIFEALDIGTYWLDKQLSEGKQ
jgi:hypothetical protein